MATQHIQAAADTEYIDTSRYERIDGQLVERPLPGDRHSEIQWNVTALLKPLAKQLNMKVHQEWTLDEADKPAHDWMTPDVLVSMPGEYRRSRIGHLLPPAFLAVEVLSPGQTPAQMVRKGKRFLLWGVQHYWAIDPDGLGFTMHAQDVPAAGMIVEETGVLQAGGLTISMADVLRRQE